MASVLPEKSKSAEPAPATLMDSISKRAHGLALDFIIKRNKKH